MDEFQDIIAEIAINTGNAEKQLAALQRGMASVETQLQKAKKGSQEYAAALNRQQLLQRQQQTLFKRYSAQVREAEQVQEALNDELVRTTQEFGKESTAAQRATNAIKAQAAEVEKLAAVAAKVGSADLSGGGGDSNLRGFTRIFTELRQATGSELQGSVLGLTGNFGQLALAVGGVGLAAGGIAAVAGAVFQLGQTAIQTAANFERMRTTLKTTFGSEGVARQVQQQLIEFAANTPFGVEQITESYIQLANRGLKLTNQQLTNLGDFAAATGKDMSQLVEAIADVNNQERWSEFGIKVSTSGNKIIGTFKGVTKEFERSEAGAAAMIQQFGALPGVAGGMAAQSQTLNGQMSNLSDNLDQLYNVIGEALLPVAKAFVGGLNEMIGALNNLSSSGYVGVIEVQKKIVQGTELEIKAAKMLYEEYQTLSNQSELTKEEKERFAAVTGQLTALLGEEVAQLDKSTGALKINDAAYQSAIRVRRLAADTEVASMVESLQKLSEAEQAIQAELAAAQAGFRAKEAEAIKKFGQQTMNMGGFSNIQLDQAVAKERQLLRAVESDLSKNLEGQKAAREALAELGLTESEQAAALLNVKTNQLATENNILESKRNQLKIELTEQRELVAKTELENQSASAALIANNNLKSAEEARIKAQDVALSLDEKRRKVVKDMETLSISTTNAQNKRKEVEQVLAKIQNDIAADKTGERKIELLQLEDAAKKQLNLLDNEIRINDKIKERNELLLGKDTGQKTEEGLTIFSGGLLEEINKKQQKELANQARESARAYQRELVEQRRKIQQFILDVEDEQNKLLVEKTTERAEKEFNVAKKRNELERQAAIDSYKEESRNKGLLKKEIDNGISAINEKFRLQDIAAERKKEQELFDIKKIFAEKQRALNSERIKAEIKEAETLLSQSFDANTSEQIVNQIADLNKKIAAQEFEAQEKALERELELAQNNAEAKQRIELDLATLRAKALADQKAAELKLIDDVAKAREEALKDEFANRAAIREQSEGQSEAEFLKKEAAEIGKFFGNQRKIQRERDRELRQQEITRAKERSALANAQFKEAEKLYDQETAAFGKARADTEIKLQQANAARIKADNEVAAKTNENTKKTLEERIAAFEEIIGYTEQVANLTVDGIRQINAANEARREKELQVATERLNIIYRDLELGRQVNEEVIRREQERIQKINEERKRAAENERALTLGQIVLQQVLAVASAAASAAKTTQWFTIPIAVASALLAITAGARQARANVAGFRKGVIRLQGGKDENAQDTVPAMLAKGESVMTVSETNRAEKILTAIRKGQLSDKDLFGKGGMLYKERNIGANQKTVNNDFALAEKFDRLIAAVEGVPSVRVSADADGLIKYTTRRQRKVSALKKR